MEKGEKIILTNMCLIENGDEVVVQERTVSWKGMCFPGGHIEKGEPLTDSVIREVFEETGLTIKNPKLCGIKDWQYNEDTRYFVFLYKANEFTGTLTSSDEGKVFWCKKEDLMSLNLSNSMDKMMKVFFDDSLSEVFAYKENDEWKYDFK